MTGNFCEVLIFVIFMVDLAVMKISTHKNLFLYSNSELARMEAGAWPKHHGSMAGSSQC